MTPAPASMPRHLVVRSDLLDRIAGGEFGDAMLPAERVLAAHYQVALGTMRRVLGDLELEGVLERRQGVGTFVRGPRVTSPMLRFFRHGSGGEAGPVAPRSEVRTVERVPGARVPGAPWSEEKTLVHLHRIRHLDDHVRLVEDIYLPSSRLRRIAAYPPETFPDLLYPLFAQHGVLVTTAHEQISIAPMDDGDAVELGVAPGGLAVTVERFADDVAGACVEWRRSRCEALKFRYAVDLT